MNERGGSDRGLVCLGPLEGTMEKELTACDECGLVYVQPVGPPEACRGCDGEAFTPIEPRELLPRSPPQKWARFLS